MKPLSTAEGHVLPFKQLSPEAFERLCLWLLEAEQEFEQIEHLGAGGSDGGRDIVARKDGEIWAFQCKKVSKFSRGEAKREINKIRSLPELGQPHYMVFVLACNLTDGVRRQIQEEWGAGDTCKFWTATHLDARVKAHPRIVREFFNVLGCDQLQGGSNEKRKVPVDRSVECVKPGPLRLLKLYTASYCRFMPEQEQNGIFRGVLYVGDKALEGIHVHPKFTNHLQEVGYSGARYDIGIEGNFFGNSVMFLAVDGRIARQNLWKYFGEMLVGFWSGFLGLVLAALGFAAYVSVDSFFLLLMPLFFSALALYMFSFAAQRVDLLLLFMKLKLAAA